LPVAGTMKIDGKSRPVDATDARAHPAKRKADDRRTEFGQHKVFWIRRWARGVADMDAIWSA